MRCLVRHPLWHIARLGGRTVGPLSDRSFRAQPLGRRLKPGSCSRDPSLSRAPLARCMTRGNQRAPIERCRARATAMGAAICESGRDGAHGGGGEAGHRASRARHAAQGQALGDHPEILRVFKELRLQTKDEIGKRADAAIGRSTTSSGLKISERMSRAEERVTSMEVEVHLPWTLSPSSRRLTLRCCAPSTSARLDTK